MNKLVTLAAVAGLSFELLASALTVPKECPTLLVPAHVRPKRTATMTVLDGTNVVCRYQLNPGLDKPDWLVPIDLSPWAGKTLDVRTSGLSAADAARFSASLSFAWEWPVPADLYREPSRPQFHVSSRQGYANDPNGLSYYRGEYHFFYQHGPFGLNMWPPNQTWGHFVSKDLVHWTELGDVLMPDDRGGIYSGSGVVDRRNTAGFGTNVHVVAYTANKPPRVQCLATSTDGRRYRKYEGNPVVPNILQPYNRDPKVYWNETLGKWTMMIYSLRPADNRHVFLSFQSDDLRHWEQTEPLRGNLNHEKRKAEELAANADIGRYLFECPDYVELPVAGEATRRWVVWGAHGEYGVGTFEGRVFREEERAVPMTYNRAVNVRTGRPVQFYYAGQTFADDPKGRVVRIENFRIKTLAGARFSRAFSLPFELGLVRTTEGLRLTTKPVEELQSLRAGPAVSFVQSTAELVEMEVDVEVGASGRVALDLRGVPVIYDAATGKLEALAGDARIVVPWSAPKGRLRLRMYLDRVGLEIFSEDGLNLLPVGEAVPDAKNRRLKIDVDNGAKVVKAIAYPLSPAWPR